MIELIPPDDDASPMELAIRASMLASLSTDPDILQNAKFKAVNAMIPMIKKYSTIVNSSLEVYIFLKNFIRLLVQRCFVMLSVFGEPSGRSLSV